MTIRMSLIIVITASALLTFMLSPGWQTQAANITQQCNRVVQHAETQSAAQACEAPTDRVTWHSWLTGQSRSTQFHFMDLFELLFSDSLKQNNQAEKTDSNFKTSL